MSLTEHLAKHLREVHFGVNWTWSNLKEHLSGLTWEQATRQVHSCNSIALLVYHMNYYLNAVSNVLKGNPLNAKHEYSLNLPPIRSQQDWENLLDKSWTDAEEFARLIEQLPENRLWEDFSEKYGNLYRNIQGVIEHNHYHLGQIVILKKILLEWERVRQEKDN